MGWQRMESAPLDREVHVYAPAAHGLDAFYTKAAHHPDAGFCVCELREPTLWRPTTELLVEPGDRLICRVPGSTPLVQGQLYTVQEVAPPLLPETPFLFEVREFPGFLFGLWRFEPTPQ